MAWDASRPVPWERLIREWLIYVAIMAVLFVVVFRDSGLAGILAGLLVSGPLYLGFGYVMAKFGYQRKTWKQLRGEASPRSSGRATSAPSGEVPRRKPAPTSRTGGGSGGGRPTKKRKQRR